MLALLLAAAVTMPADWDEAIANYQRALDEAKRGGSIERLLDRATELKRVLLPLGEGETPFEKLDEHGVDDLHDLLPGVILGNYETLLADPDPKFFLELARANGRDADVAFFEQFLLTYRDDALPSYVELTSTWSGCTTLGRGDLIERYDGWSKFRAKYSGYRKYVDRELSKIEEEIATDCVCDDRDAALLELNEFIRRFPKTPASPIARKQLREIRRGRLHMRYFCRPG